MCRLLRLADSIPLPREAPHRPNKLHVVPIAQPWGPALVLHLLFFVQAEEIVELCDNAEKLFKQERSVLELKVCGQRCLLAAS